MLTEAALLKRSIQYLLDFEDGHEIAPEGFWMLNHQLYAWQRDFDPDETLFPPPIGVTVDLKRFEAEYWPQIRDEERFFSNNVERAFNMCLAALSSQAWDDDRALQMLFVINPNLILERFAQLEDVELTYIFEEEEIDLVHDLMVNRLRTAEKRIATLNFLRKAGEELRANGLDFFAYFRKLEKKIQDKMVHATPAHERVLSTEDKKSPELTIVPGGLE